MAKFIGAVLLLAGIVCGIVYLYRALRRKVPRTFSSVFTFDVFERGTEMAAMRKGWMPQWCSGVLYLAASLPALPYFVRRYGGRHAGLLVCAPVISYVLVLIGQAVYLFVSNQFSTPEPPGWRTLEMGGWMLLVPVAAQVVVAAWIAQMDASWSRELRAASGWRLKGSCTAFSAEDAIAQLDQSWVRPPAHS